MNIILGILMVAVTGLYVALPFFRRDADEEEPVPAPMARAEILERQKRDAYAAIKEAEFDYEMGKLSDADLATLTEKYRQLALAAIAGLENSESAVEVGGATHSPTRIAFCATCGRKLPGKANFCPSCGRAIRIDRAALQAGAGSVSAGAVAQTG